MLKGAYLRAAIKAEMKRALGRGERTLRRDYLCGPGGLGISPAIVEREISRAAIELFSNPNPAPAKGRGGPGAGPERHSRTRAHAGSTAERGRNG